MGDSYSEGEDVLADSSGNLYVKGYIYGNFNGNKNLGSKDIIIVIYSSGTKQLTKQYGTSSDDEGKGITLDSSGYITLPGILTVGFMGIKMLDTLIYFR